MVCVKTEFQLFRDGPIPYNDLVRNYSILTIAFI